MKPLCTPNCGYKSSNGLDNLVYSTFLTFPCYFQMMIRGLDVLLLIMLMPYTSGSVSNWSYNCFWISVKRVSAILPDSSCAGEYVIAPR